MAVSASCAPAAPVGAPPSAVSAPAPRRARPNDVAVVINGNARHVTPKMVARVTEVVGAENVFFSRTLEEAQRQARRIVRRGYAMVVCGGGDGTFVTALNLIGRRMDERNAALRQQSDTRGLPFAPVPTPAYGLLCLGTGNAMRHVVQARAPLADLRRLHTRTDLTVKSVPVIRDDRGERFLFAGLGHDSLILHDYNRLRAQMPPLLRRSVASNIGGYAMAILSRSVPRYLRGRAQVGVTVTTVGPAYYVDPRRGDALVPLAAGSEIYRGDVAMLGVSTVPYLGYGIKMFPFAEARPGHMHLRVATTSPLQMMAHLGGLWRGTYRDAGRVFDYVVSDIQVTLDRPFRFQHSGEARGRVSRLHLKVDALPLRLLTQQAQGGRPDGAGGVAGGAEA